MRRRILIIEDEPAVAAYLAVFLEQEGFSVERVSSLEQGRTRALSGEHQLILLDIMFPDGSADQIIPELRSCVPEVPILMVSGVPGDDPRLGNCLKAGAAGYIPKTARVDELLGQIRRVLRD